MMTFADRIRENVQKQHELNIEMRTILSELQDHNERQSDMIYMVEVRYEKVAASNVVTMPIAEDPDFAATIPVGIKPTGRK